MRFTIEGEIYTPIEENEIKKKDGTTFVSYEFSIIRKEKKKGKEQDQEYRFKVMEFLLGKMGRLTTGMMVEVDFSIICKRYGDRFFTNLYAWDVTEDDDYNMKQEIEKVKKEDESNEIINMNNIEDELPF